MNSKLVIAASLTVFLILTSASLQAEVVTDDFNDGIIHHMWVLDEAANGVSVKEREYNPAIEDSGCLHISGTTSEPSPWYGGNIMNLLFDGNNGAEAQMKFKIPQATKGATISLHLIGTESRLMLSYTTWGGYQLSTLTRSGWHWNGSRDKNGDEASQYNLLKIVYDPILHKAYAYVYDNAKNEVPVAAGGIPLDLGSSLPKPKLTFGIQYSTEFDSTIDIKVDDFRMEATPYSELVPPPVALGVSLGERHDFEPGSDDLLTPEFSNDGKKLAFKRRSYPDPNNPDPSTSLWNIYIKDLTSDEPAYRITEDTAFASVRGGASSFSPNDMRFFFIKGSPHERPTIQYVDATTETDKISHLYFEGLYTDARVTGIDFTRTEDNEGYHTAVFLKNNDLYTIPVDDFGDPKPGSNPRQLTDVLKMSSGIHGLRWSPDGTKIALSFGITGHSLAIWVVDVAGMEPGEIIQNENNSNVTVITDDRNFAAVPNFSHDGRYLYYCEDVANRFIGGTNGWDRYNDVETMLGDSNFDLFFVELADEGGATPKRLTDAPLSQGVFSASPDGTILAYNTDDNTDGDGIRDGDIYIQKLVFSETIPDSGGEVSDGSGTTVIIPSGAFPEGTPEMTISIQTPFPGSEPPLDTLAPGTSLALAREFEPDGQWFELPITIEIHYTDEEVAGLNEANLQIYYYDDELGRWEALPKLPDGEGCTDTEANIVCAETYHYSTFAALDVPYLIAGVEIDPGMLNKKSKGKYITAYIELPAGFSPANIDVSSIEMNDSIAALNSPTEIGDHNGNGTADLMLKFDRAAVQAMLPLGWAPVKISGQLNNGIPFEHSLSIYVFEKGKDHTNEIDPDSILE